MVSLLQTIIGPGDNFRIKGHFEVLLTVYSHRCRQFRPIMIVLTISPPITNQVCVVENLTNACMQTQKVFALFSALNLIKYGRFKTHFGY